MRRKPAPLPRNRLGSRAVQGAVTRATWGVISAGLFMLATACSGSSEVPKRCVVPTEPIAVRAQQVPVVHEKAGWNLAVVVQNTADESRRIRLGLDGRRALDVTMPASPACSQGPEPLAEFHFSVGRHRVAVLASSSGGTLRTIHVVVPRNHRRWLLVTDYGPRRLGLILHAYRERPLFG